MSRFQVENLARIRAFYDLLVAIGAGKKATPGQLALAWLQHQGQNHILPILGTTKLKNLQENVGALAVKLTLEELKEIANAMPKNEVIGDQYLDEFMHSTWMHVTSPPLLSWTGPK